MNHLLPDILQRIEKGELSAEAALLELGVPAGEKDLGFARLDLDRLRRRGLPEVVYAPSKTPEQLAAIAAALLEAGQNLFITRASRAQFEAVQARLASAVYHETARIITCDVTPLPAPKGLVAVVTAGTTDIPVAEEAAVTAERMGARVERLYDVGVAGLHRLLNRLSLLRKARVLIVVAGMEGALPSVVGGLVAAPVIAVPTSVGYGAHFQGLAPLLAMLNSCAPGVTVVNIDNGFGAGVAAALINRLGEGGSPDQPSS